MEFTIKLYYFTIEEYKFNLHIQIQSTSELGDFYYLFAIMNK